MLKHLPLAAAAATAFVVFPALYAFAGYTLFTRIFPGSSLATVACFFAIALLVIGVLEFLRFAATDRMEDRPWSHFLVNLVFFHAGAGIVVLIGYLIAGLLQADPPWTAALALVIGVFVAASPLTKGFPIGSDGFMNVLRGRSLLTKRQLERQIQRSTDDPGLIWGGQRIPTDNSTRHFLVVGTTGSGKTVTLQLLMEQALRDIKPGSDRRALLFDAKGDLYSLLQNFKLSVPVRILNPFDERSYGWNLAADFTEPEDAIQLAKMLIPKTGHESQPFFPDAAVTVLSSLAETFHAFAPDAWTLRDLLCGAALDIPSFQKICDRLPHVGMTLRRVIEAREFPSVMVTLPVTLKPFYPVAAAWELARKQKRLFSFKEWNNAEEILLIPNVHTQKETLTPLNRLFLRRIVDILLDNPNHTPKRTWLFLDELAQLGRIDDFSENITLFRSKGISAAIGIQELAGLFKDKCYGPEEAKVIISQCNNRAFLRTIDQATAEWAVKQIGEIERFVTITSKTEGRGVSSTTQAQHLDKTTNVLATELPDLVPNRGYYKAFGIQGAWCSTYSQEFLDANLTEGGDPNNDFIRRTALAPLKPWDEKDLERLKLTFLAPDPPSTHESNGHVAGFRRIHLPRKHPHDAN